MQMHYLSNMCMVPVKKINIGLAAQFQLQSLISSPDNQYYKKFIDMGVL